MLCDYITIIEQSNSEPPSTITEVSANQRVMPQWLLGVTDN